jgi:CBS domain containing-hemolysin-like protein
LAQAHGPHELRMLIESSREHGTLDPPQHELLTAMLAIADTTVGQVMTPAAEIIAVEASATAREVERTSRAAGRSRLAVIGPDGVITGIVNVRDAARATTRSRDATAADLMTPPFALPTDTPVAVAVRAMREHRVQLAVVTGPGSATAGLVALEDLLEELIAELDDETDPVPAAVHRATRTSPPVAGTPVRNRHAEP